MANKNLFQSQSVAPATTTVNNAGGKAYSLQDKAALAQLICTGTLSNTFYTTDEKQLDDILAYAKKVPVKYLAQLALYARDKAYMKDTPALLCAVLAERDVSYLKPIFNKVINNGKMLRNFVQIVRSGKVGRKSFGTAVKKLIQRWFSDRKDYQLFKDSVGNTPSLADIIKMVHPTPQSKEREALYGYLIGKKVVTKKADMEKVHGRYTTVMLSDLPECIQEYEVFKSRTLAGLSAEVPNVEFRLLTALNLSDEQWTSIAKNAPWTMTRMNLNTFARHNVFKDVAMVKLVAERLANKEEVQKAKAFPYQLMTAYLNATDTPNTIQNALQDAMEHAVENVPDFGVNKIHVLVDTSGSMGSPVTGNRGSVSTSTRCVDVAGLIASCILRKNDDVDVLPFDTQVHTVSFNSRDSIVTNAKKFARNGGGTDCSCALSYLNRKKAVGDLVVMCSDNESWASMSSGRNWYNRSTDMSSEWKTYKARNPKAKLVLIDLTPNTHTQVCDSKDVLNIGGFSDTYFEIIHSFVNGELDGGHFVEQIEKVEVDIDPVARIVKSGAAKAVKKSVKKVVKKKK